MQRWLAVLTFAAMVCGLVGAPAGAAALSADPCGDAENGVYPNGYEVVWGGNGGPGNQLILGDGDNNTLKGGSGNDILCGFGGDDTLIGGSGNDWVDGGDGEDVLRGNSGNDTLANGETNRGGSGNNHEITIVPPPVVGADCAFAQAFDYPDSTPNLSYKDLRNCDLSGADLRGAFLDGADLTGANLSGADLYNVYAYSTIWNNTTCPDGSNSDAYDGDDFTCFTNR